MFRRSWSRPEVLLLKTFYEEVGYDLNILSLQVKAEICPDVDLKTICKWIKSKLKQSAFAKWIEIHGIQHSKPNIYQHIDRF